MRDVDFGVEFRRPDHWWDDLEHFALYEDAVDYALKVQSQHDECRIIMYKALDYWHHKSRIVAVFKPMPRGWITKAKGEE